MFPINDHNQAIFTQIRAHFFQFLKMSKEDPLPSRSSSASVFSWQYEQFFHEQVGEL